MPYDRAKKKKWGSLHAGREGRCERDTVNVALRTCIIVMQTRYVMHSILRQTKLYSTFCQVEFRITAIDKIWIIKSDVNVSVVYFQLRASGFSCRKIIIVSSTCSWKIPNRCKLSGMLLIFFLFFSTFISRAKREKEKKEGGGDKGEWAREILYASHVFSGAQWVRRPRAFRGSRDGEETMMERSKPWLKELLWGRLRRKVSQNKQRQQRLNVWRWGRKIDIFRGSRWICPVQEKSKNFFYSLIVFAVNYLEL